MVNLDKEFKELEETVAELNRNTDAVKQFIKEVEKRINTIGPGISVMLKKYPMEDGMTLGYKIYAGRGRIIVRNQICTDLTDTCRITQLEALPLLGKLIQEITTQTKRMIVQIKQAVKACEISTQKY